MKQLKWQAWEYRVLAEGHDVSKTARLIRRTEREVRDKLDSLNSTVKSWYARNRIHAAPNDYWRMYRLAYTVWNRDYSDRVDEDNIESQVINTLTFCFEKFDPSKGNQALPLENRFCKHFAFWFTRHLKDSLRDDDYDRRKSTLRYLKWKATLNSYHERNPYTAWSRIVKNCVLIRLDREAQSFIRLNRLEQLTLTETARQLHTSLRSLNRRYGRGRIIELIKEEITRMFLNIPQANMERLIWTLYVEEGFSRDKLCSLFNVPRPVIDKLIRDVSDKVYDRVELSEAESLFAQKEKQNISSPLPVGTCVKY